MRRRWRRTIAATAIGAMVAVAAPARARGQDGAGQSAAPSSAEGAREASRAAYRRGAAEYDSGSFEAARDSFAEAYKLFPHPSILYSLGLSRLKTRDYLLAEKDLLKFLEDDGGAPPQEVANARAALAQVRQHLGTFLLRVAPTGARAQLDDDPVALIPGKFVEVRTTTGTHTLRVDATGFEPREQTVVVGAASSNVEVDLRRAGDAGGGGDARAGTTSAGRATAGWILVGAGGAAAAFSVFAALRAKSLSDDYNTPNSGAFQDASTRRSGITFRTLADVAGGGALVAAGIGIYLLLAPVDRSPQSSSSTSRPSRGEVGVDVVLGPAYAGLRARF